LYIFLLQIVFISILQIAYVYFIVHHYSDMRFTAKISPDEFVIGEALFVSALLLANLFAKDDFMFSIFHTIISFFLAPNIVLFQFMQSNVVIVLGIISILVWAVLWNLIFPTFTAKRVKGNQRLLLLLVLTIIFLTPFFITFGFDISPAVFDFDEVYSVRVESDLRSNLITNYTYSLVTTWLLPLCLIFGYMHRNVPVIVSSIAGLLYMFAVTGNRITFFVIFVIVAFLFFRTYRAKLLAMYTGICVLFTMGLIFFDEIPQIADLLIRRFLFLPALLNIQYLEFFNGRPVLYSHSFLSSVFDYPYDVPPPRVIGYAYYQGGNMTNGIVSDGFLNLGYIGIFFNTLLAGAIITFFNKLKVNAIFFGLFFLLVQKFIDSGMFTALLTHGVFAFMLASLFLISHSENLGTDA
jgi:hypothetical protein